MIGCAARIGAAILTLASSGWAQAAVRRSFASCAGCHLSEAREPKSRFPSGLGRWSDLQCVGCHSEINAISKLLAASEPGRLNFHLPLSLDMQRAIAKNPLSLGSVPLLAKFPLQDRKYDIAGLAWFIERPPGVRSSMPSFPARGKGANAALRNEVVPSRLHTAINGQAVQRGQALFTEKGCLACHGNSGTAPHFVGFVRFTEKHLSEVASGSFSKEGRTMPVIPLRFDEAADIRSWIATEKAERETEMDARVAALTPVVMAPKAQSSDASHFAAYLFGPFVREGTCVHCHATLTEAKRRFDGTGESLRKYVTSGGATDLWRRLETRHLETNSGVTAHEPGMPMNGKPIPRSFVTRLGEWIQTGCQDEHGYRICDVRAR